MRSASTIGECSYDFVKQYPKIQFFTSHLNFEAIKNMTSIFNEHHEIPYSTTVHTFINLINYYFINFV